MRSKLEDTVFNKRMKLLDTDSCLKKVKFFSLTMLYGDLYLYQKDAHFSRFYSEIFVWIELCYCPLADIISSPAKPSFGART